MSALHPSTAVAPTRTPAGAPPAAGPALPAPAPMRSRRAVLLIPLGLAVIALAMYLWWPAGVVVGLVLGVAVVLGIGGAQQHAADAVPVADGLGELFSALQPAAPAPTPTPVVQALAPARSLAALTAPDRAPAPRPLGVRADLDRLKAELGDGYPDFARAARLVVSTQYASAARLQRDLHLPYSRARRLLADLETEHFVGPATGTLPRQVLLPKDRLPEVEQLFAGV